MTTEFLNMIPVLPSQNIDRDVKWYAERGPSVFYQKNGSEYTEQI